VKLNFGFSVPFGFSAWVGAMAWFIIGVYIAWSLGQLWV
jgi:membrane protein DedA with SNARE-associated domain